MLPLSDLLPSDCTHDYHETDVCRKCGAYEHAEADLAEMHKTRSAARKCPNCGQPVEYGGRGPYCVTCTFAASRVFAQRTK